MHLRRAFATTLARSERYAVLEATDVAFFKSLDPTIVVEDKDDLSNSFCFFFFAF